MTYVAIGIRLASSLAAMVVTCALVGVLWTHREDAAAPSLLGVGIVLFAGSVVHAAVVGGPMSLVDPLAVETDVPLWIVFGIASASTAGGVWTLFAFRYTGRDQRIYRAVFVCVAVLGTFNGSIAILAVIADLSAILVELFTVGFLLTGFLVTVGTFLLLWVSVGHNAFPIREPLFLSGGILAALSGILSAQVFQYPVLYPTLLTVAGLLFLYPIVRYPIFETLPAARVAGRDDIVDELDDGILIVNRQGTIRDANPAAEQQFDRTHGDLRNTQLSALLDTAIEAVEIVDSDAPIRVESADTTTLELTGDRITDQRNRTFGYAILCDDITTRRTREDQMSLLSQFVADIVRDDMSSIATTAAGSGSETAPDQSERAERIWTTTTALTRLVARTRDIEDAVAETQGVTSSQDLRPAIRRSIERVRTESGPQLTAQLTDGPFTAPISAELCETIVVILLDDASEHATEQVTLETTVEDCPSLQIRDDRVSPDEESSDHKTSVLSTEIVKVTVEQLGGTLSVTHEDGYHSVTVGLPQARPAARRQR